MSKTYLLPNSTIGIIGGGQLGRMMALAAKAMGYKVIVLDPTVDAPCAQVADEQIVANYTDLNALKELAEKSDVVTYEFENVDNDALHSIENSVRIPQGSELLSITQDRILEKAYLESLNINLAPYAVIVDRDDIEQHINSLGYPAVLKTTQGGYDGKGQYVIQSEEDIDKAVELLRFGTCVLEAWIPFEREVSVIVARNSEGQIETFPVAENDHKNNILHTTVVPAALDEESIHEAEAIAVKLAEYLHLEGVLAVEMFVTGSGAIYVNELAPRPHNSGHYTIEACNISQFTQHIRAIAGLPLLKPELLRPAMMVNILGQHVDGVNEVLAEHPDWFVHYYGKQEAKIDRKMGHITVLSDNPLVEVEKMRATQIWR
ncbi:5-(carboxyamino)imidazole ribonucleotide synthase [Listeria booriae]|uniref:N5-carboxyaminoimidazole ribonucleotide synthase n=1 Tax=Listeria booriae TaxID=1552123 RepID=A0A7X0YNU8_9LIST|nr:5-(carboxyamino)imidazole ribonucleotide synthase [Listeria booriae]MBC1228315.1 5-(carboxyamino)imidazole ribonucleotide synthase [Listeria booriae]MBC1231743.1 5-(carboxyamino)imidazole ribonucleotide synthase [Listeria booriae]MBC1273910.1 5-(carboxyamino)imidazole ribonucleotide synthase [Listeria booriae]MBC1287130.1 5-(carboxyamino)imidazole ribonucleotide synthase [Listeria booriae]MBC1318048.1 5-(carboxyamino)imidazole ribonucleotide synthase [Listeria booriae]